MKTIIKITKIPPKAHFYSHILLICHCSKERTKYHAKSWKYLTRYNKQIFRNSSSLSSDLNAIIFQEESRHAAHLSQVKQNVYYDFESVKEQIKFIVSTQAYTANPDGSHTVTIMYLQYQNTILRYHASEYLTLKTEQCNAIGKSFLTRSYTTG